MAQTMKGCESPPWLEPWLAFPRTLSSRPIQTCTHTECTGAQDYRFQILFSREESLRLHWNTPVHLMSLQQKQGVYKLNNLPEWDVLKDAVGKAEKGELQASGSDFEAVRLHLATALKHVEQSGEG